MWLVLGLVGLAAGIISTVLGIGGGILIVPALHFGFGIPFAEATAVSLAVITFHVPLGLWTHARRGAVDWRLAAPMAITGGVGVAAGFWLQPRIPVAGLQFFFAAIMVLAAIRLITKLPVGQGTPGVAYLGTTGLLAGATSKLLGVGGGIVTVPMLSLRGVKSHTAVASSLVPVFTNAALASAAAVALGLDVSLVPPMVLGALLGAPVGTMVAHALPEIGLRRVVAGGLVAGAVYVAWRAVTMV